MPSVPVKSPATIARGLVERVVPERDRRERLEAALAVALENRDLVVALIGDSQVERCRRR